MTHYGLTIGARDGLQVIDCKSCGYAHLETLPTEAELVEFYKSDFWQTYKAGELEKYESQLDWLNTRAQDWLELLANHVSGYDLLDYGAGYGHFAMQAMRDEWRVEAIEPSETAAAYALAHRVRVIPIHEAGKYNAISALWLIEHLYNPVSFLQWVRAHLLEGGCLLLAAPNDFTEIQARANEIAKRKFWWIDKSHLNYFTPSSMANLLGLSGFKIVERQTMYQMEKEILDGQDYTDNPQMGKICHAAVMAEDMRVPRSVRTRWYADQALSGMGREIILIAKAV